MPRTSSDLEPEFFNAPMGTRVRVFTWIGFVLIAAFVAFNIGLALRLPVAPRDFWLIAFSPCVGLVVIIPVVLHARIHGYRLASGELQVQRLGRINRFALAGLERVEVNPGALKGARKTIGNDGAGAITGNFRSDALGTFEVLVTDPTRTVVLRWPDHALVVSPGEPEKFAERARAMAGLRR